MKTGFSTAILLAAFSLLQGAPTLVQAQLTYTTDNGTITITKYTGPGWAEPLRWLLPGHSFLPAAHVWKIRIP